jgi:hypothetical protein
VNVCDMKQSICVKQFQGLLLRLPVIRSYLESGFK